MSRDINNNNNPGEIPNAPIVGPLPQEGEDTRIRDADREYQDLYDRLFTNFTLEDFDFPEEFVQSLIPKRFNPDYVAHTVLTKVGDRALVVLSVLGVTRGANVEKMRGVRIRCEGTNRGTFTLQELVARNVILPHNIRSVNNQAAGAFSLSQIASATPQFYMMDIRRRRNHGQSIETFRKNVTCNLPVELQYTQAGGLPLPDNLRSAHLYFMAHFSHVLGKVFDPFIYRNQMSQADRLRKYPHVMQVIGELSTEYIARPEEQNLTLEAAEAVSRALQGGGASMRRRM